MTARKKPAAKKAAVKKPVKKPAPKKPQQVAPQEQETPLEEQQPQGQSQAASLEAILIDNSVRQRVATEAIARGIYDENGNPLLPGLMESGLMLQQHLIAIINGSYVKAETYNQLIKQYNDVVSAYKQMAGQFNHLKEQNAKLTQHLQGNVAQQNQHLII